MSDRPILFSAPMVRAILAGTKTQTRRAVKPWEPRLMNLRRPVPDDVSYLPDFTCYRSTCPYGQPGDRLWVRETWAFGTHALAAARDEDGPFVYAADGTTQGRLCDRWRPSIHMPRSASRITLEVTGVRVERLQDISEADARAEGASCRRISSGDARMGLSDWWSFGTDRGGEDIGGAFTAKQGYELLWESINGAGSWDANPWVWVIGFDVQSTRSES